MSDLLVVSEVLEMAKEIVGHYGPVKIDTGIYSHNIHLEESEKGEDMVILGNENTQITLAMLADFFDELDSKVNDLEDDTGRTYTFNLIEKSSEKEFSIIWGS